MTSVTKVIVALLTLLVIGVISGVMYEVTVFLFAFSGGQARMEPVVNYGALAVVAATILVAIVSWRARSPAEAVKYTAIATGVLWVAALIGEWGFSFTLGAG